MKIDLACGKNKKEGFIGWDISPDSDADLVIDLKKTPWPVEDKSVEEVSCQHFFEHLTGPERISFMDELYRVMKEDSKATFVTPYWASMRAVQDPTHAWPPVCETSYLYFNKGWRDANKLDHYPIKADFDFTYGYYLDGECSVRSAEYQQFATKFYVNSVMDLQVVLTRRPD